LGGRQYGDEFRIIKKFTTAILKKFGFGERAVMENIILDESNELIKYIRG